MKRGIFLVIVFLIVLLSSISIYASSIPSNDDTFYVSIYSDTYSMNFGDFPGEELGLGPTAHGLFISKGKVIQNINNTVTDLFNHSSCNKPPARVCKFEGKIKGTYSNGHLDVTFRVDNTAVLNGAPLWPSTKPVQPATLNLFTETHLEADLVDEKLMSFRGKAEHKNSWNWINGCAKWKDNDVGGSCEIEDYTVSPVKTEKYDWWGYVSAPKPGIAVISDIKGDVEFSKNGKNFREAKLGDIVKPGNFVATGFESSADLDFGYAKLEIYSLTQFRVDQSSSKENISKTQLDLRVGAVKPILKHNDTIRGDFSVSTPTSISSIRGSEMVVSYDNQTNTTTTYVLEDEAFVKGNLDSTEMTVLENKKTNIDATGKASQPESFSSSELPQGSLDSDSNGSSWFIYVIVVIVIIAAYFFYKKKSKMFKNK